MAYIGTSPSNGVRRVFDYTATAGQDTFQSTDNNGQSLVYTDSAYIDVYQNGILLLPSDYVATSGTTVVLDVAAALEDTVQIVAYDVFSVADTVSASEGGSFAGNVGVGGTLAVTGIGTFSDDIIIGDGKTIGSASDVDAMAISSGGVVTFSQNTIGAGGMDLLLSDTISSPIAAYDITSTYINSSYNAYIIQAEFLPTNDGVYFYSQVFVGGTIQTGSIYGREMGAMSSSAYYNDNTATEFALYNYSTIGNAVGEGITINANLQNVNSTTRPCAITGTSTYFNTSALPNNAFFGGTLLPANRANIVNGLRFYGSADTGGNTIASGTVKLYGVL